MKAIKRVNNRSQNLIVKLARIFIVAACVGSGFAQTLSIQSGSLAANLDWSSAPDLQVMLQAVEATEPAPAESAPQCGMFYSAQFPNWPPLPGNLKHVPVWSLGDGSYLVDDLDVNYSPQPLASSMREGGMRTMDGLSPDGSNGIFTPDYGSNLWLEIAGVMSNAVNLNLHNTESDVQYEIQSRQNLLDTQWISEGFVFGSEITNLTATNVLQRGRSNLFLRIRSWLDSYDMGIPDWWQLQYFGMIGIDPYGDPTGDGYSNLYKYQHGLNPLTSYAPQPPTFRVTPIANDNGIIVSWNPAQGAVMSYTIYRNGSAIATVSSNQFSYEDDSATVNLSDPNDNDFPVYTVQANYSGSAYSSPEEPPFNPRWSISPAIVRGAQGQYILLVPNIPSGVAFIRFYPQPSGAAYPDGFFNIETYQ